LSEYINLLLTTSKTVAANCGKWVLLGKGSTYGCIMFDSVHVLAQYSVSL